MKGRVYVCVHGWRVRACENRYGRTLKISDWQRGTLWIQEKEMWYQLRPMTVTPSSTHLSFGQRVTKPMRWFEQAGSWCPLVTLAKLCKSGKSCLRKRETTYPKGSIWTGRWPFHLFDWPGEVFKARDSQLFMDTQCISLMPMSQCAKWASSASWTSSCYRQNKIFPALQLLLNYWKHIPWSQTLRLMYKVEIK